MIVGILFQHDAHAAVITDKLVSAGANGIGGGGFTGLPVLHALVKVLGQDEVGVPGQCAQNGSVRGLQGHDEGVVVGAVHFGNGVIQLLRNDTAVFHNHLIGKFHVRGAKGFAVVPLHALAQVESVGQAILGDGVGLAQIGNDLIIPVQLEQTVVQILEHGPAGVVGLRVRVEALGIFGHRDDKGLGLVSESGGHHDAKHQANRQNQGHPFPCHWESSFHNHPLCNLTNVKIHTQPPADRIRPAPSPDCARG